MADVLILMGSDSDLDYMEASVEELKKAGVTFAIHVASAHRTPERVAQLVLRAEETGTGVVIAGAGGAAALAGVVAAHTILPVIGVPLPTLGLGGADALLATVQMPRGIPVATVGMGNSANAGLLAIQILALANERLKEYMTQYRIAMKEKVLAKDKKIQLRFNT
ncbi:5-(carboxyamino)imidazole ribonucleotide mutase [Myxococcota bacterium]|nr:5-(carboxyamino)imidazole ribonucleotide mutase [Myxococcota bacterium]